MFCVKINFLAYFGLVRLILYVFRNIFCLSEVSNPIPYSEPESLSLLQCFRFLVSFFLDHLLELVHFLALVRKRLLCGIGFLSAVLSGAEINFFRSVFIKLTAISTIVHCERTPMLLAKVAKFLGTSFLWDSGTKVSTRLLRILFIAKLSRCKKRLISQIFPGHMRA